MNQPTDMFEPATEARRDDPDTAPFRYIDRKDYDLLLNEENLPHVLHTGGIFI